MACPDVVPESRSLRKRYDRHQPENTVLYQVVQAWLGTFLRMASEAYERPLPRYVQQEFHKYLRCGMVACGFARAYCRDCGASMLVAFSCKLRGVCPSCGARRASQTAMNLVDRVLPRVPIRQWVLTVPFELRLLLAKDPPMLSAVVRILCAEISRLMQRLGEEKGIRQGATGMVAAIQLFGSSINLNPHTHVLALDGAYHNDGQQAVFTQVRAPSDAEVADVVRRIQARVIRTLKRRGLLRDPADSREPGNDDPVERCGQLSLRIGKLGRVDEQGRVLPDDDDMRFAKRGKRLCADIDGWNLHAAVTVHAGDDVGRENLCRYVLRHPISLQRLSMTTDGRVAYRLKLPRGKKTHLLMEPVQFVARLASIIPPPRHPLFRYVGVLSSASRWRKHVVPQANSKAEQLPSNTHDTQGSAPKRPPTDVKDTLAGASNTKPSEGELTPAVHRGAIGAATNYVDWATLLRRVFNLDALACATCGGRLRMIAVITQQPVITKILDALGLPSQLPVPQARGPDPQLSFDPVLSVP